MTEQLPELYVSTGSCFCEGGCSSSSAEIVLCAVYLSGIVGIGYNRIKLSGDRHNL